jgi:phosphoribosylaminoimidazole-succinocarboxamide synthase
MPTTGIFDFPAIVYTQFDFSPLVYRPYTGKVRDVYIVNEEYVVLVATDRISAFDVVFAEPIPGKGQVLTELAAFFLKETAHLCPNFALDFPDPNVTIGKKCEPYPIEFIVRGHLCGHAWRLYNSGIREISGVSLPDGLVCNAPLPEPILTPTTKSAFGHDTDVTEAEIVKSGLIPGEELAQIKYYAFQLFEFGQRYAREKGLLLADTKYEFGQYDFDIMLIDEIHTPDSSRYFLLDGFEERQATNATQPQYSKEFFRQWLIEYGFQGEEEQSIPELGPEIIGAIQGRYIELYERLLGKPFVIRADADPVQAMYPRIISSLQNLAQQKG